MNTITFGEWVGCFFVIFIHLIENSGGYFYWCRLFLWILDINLQNFVGGYFSKFSVWGLQRSTGIKNCSVKNADVCWSVSRWCDEQSLESQLPAKKCQIYHAHQGKILTNVSPLIHWSYLRQIFFLPRKFIKKNPRVQMESDREHWPRCLIKSNRC